MIIYGSFYGYELRGNISRLFVIYATDEGLLGGWIAPCDYEELLARFGGHGMVNQNSAAVQQHAQNAVKWESHYQQFLSQSSAFVEAHEHNFAFPAPEISAVLTWKLKFGERASTRFGALDITPHGGKKRRFYLVGRRTPEEVAALVQKALPLVTIEGGAPADVSSTPLPNSQPTIENAGTIAEPVYKQPNWPLVILGWFAAIGISLVIASLFNFWIPLAACVIAPMFYKMMRFGGMATNYYSRSA
jgi:hypothetical protein